MTLTFSGRTSNRAASSPRVNEEKVMMPSHRLKEPAARLENTPPASFPAMEGESMKKRS